MTWQRSATEFHAWAAGAFETGGSVAPTRVSLTTSDKSMTDDLTRFFGGKTQTVKGSNLLQPASYTWSLSGIEEISRFIRAILPFLHDERQADARVILNGGE